MTNFVSVRISNKFEIRAEMEHDFCNSHGRKINDNPNFIINNDGSDTEYNRDVIGLIDTKNIYDKHVAVIVAAQEDYKKHHPRALKSNTNLTYAGIITFGRDDGLLSRLEMDSKDQRLLDACARKLLREFALKNGINIDSTYLVKHCDESMTHYHFKFIAYDFERHEVMRNRMGPHFLSGLQDLAGECFAPSGFGRGIKKIDRIDQVLYESGLTLDDYAAMTPVEKSVILKRANVKNKPPKELHIKLKNDAFSLQESLNTSLNLFEMVEKLTSEQLQAIEESIDNSGDKLVSRFFVYAKRLHNDAADKQKAIKNLSATIEKLGNQKANLEDEFRKYQAIRADLVLPIPAPAPVSDRELGIDTRVDTKGLFGVVTLKKEAYDNLVVYLARLENKCRFYFNKYNDQTLALAPLLPHVAELKNLVDLKDTIAQLQTQKNNLDSDISIKRSEKETRDLAQHQAEIQGLELTAANLQIELNKLESDGAIKRSAKEKRDFDKHQEEVWSLESQKGKLSADLIRLEAERNNLESNVAAKKSVKEQKELEQHQAEVQALELMKHKLRGDIFTLEEDASLFDKRVTKIEARLAEVKGMAIELVKNPLQQTRAAIEEIKTEARRLEIEDVKQLEEQRRGMH